MVMLEKGVEPEKWLNQKMNEGSIPFRLHLKQKLSPRFNILLLTYDHRILPPEWVLEVLKNQEGVQLAQYNHQIEQRKATATLPNDPSFATQWALHNTGQSGGTAGADIAAADAWDLNTGGLSAQGGYSGDRDHR